MRFKIYSLNTYRPFFALLLIALLVNAFALQQIHYATGHSHDHTAHLLDDHEDCGNGVHFHEAHFHPECNICDFNFSPKESVEFGLLPPATPQANTTVFAYKTIVVFENDGAPVSLRGPPTYFI